MRFGVGSVAGYDVGCVVGFAVGYGQIGTMPTATKTNCVLKTVPKHQIMEKVQSLLHCSEHSATTPSRRQNVPQKQFVLILFVLTRKQTCIRLYMNVQTN